MDQEMKAISEELNRLLCGSGKTISSAESCTGGNIAAAITAIPGSSEYFKGSIVVYSDEMKVKYLDVKQETLDKYTVYSEQVVKEMVVGTCAAFGADYAVATSGVAGPGGGTEDIPVGTVWIAVGTPYEIVTWKRTSDEGRIQNIQSAAKEAMEMLLEFVISKQSTETEEN